MFRFAYLSLTQLGRMEPLTPAERISDIFPYDFRRRQINRTSHQSQNLTATR
jgi:hypothetical protein